MRLAGRDQPPKLLEARIHTQKRLRRPGFAGTAQAEGAARAELHTPRVEDAPARAVELVLERAMLSLLERQDPASVAGERKTVKGLDLYVEMTDGSAGVERQPQNDPVALERARLGE